MCTVADPGRGAESAAAPLFLADFCFFGRFLLFSGAASRNLDSRPPLFTDPGSASGVGLNVYKGLVFKVFQRSEKIQVTGFTIFPHRLHTVL